MQVYACWQLLTARPDADDLAQAPHALYGHIAETMNYSVGAWLRDVAPVLSGPRPIIVGGTGLYFRALTEGLADIPEVPQDTRDDADALAMDRLLADLAQHDPLLLSRIDRQNRARVQRGWEVWRATGRPLSAWQDDTGPPLLPLSACHTICLDANAGWLAERIARRFHKMLDGGVLEEVRAVLPRWPLPGGAGKAIGAPDLIAHLRGEIDLATATERAIIASRQYAKRQRTWFRARMRDWQHVALPAAEMTDNRAISR